MGMSRTNVLLLTACAALDTTAQLSPLPLDTLVDLDRGWGHVVSLSASSDYNANTVYNELPVGIYRGGYLDNDLRQRSLNALTSDRNTAGYLLEGRINWTGPVCFPKIPRWRPVVSIAHHDVGGTRFTEDQYALAFFGNADYEDQKAILAPSAYQQVRYQTLGAGLQHVASNSFLRFDLVRGQSYAAADVQWASLFTGEDGRVLRTTFLGDYYASDTAGSGFDRTNGLGVAASARWNTHFKLGARGIDLGVGVEDFGFVRWNANSVRIQQDTLFTYSGWAVDNIFALDNVIIGEDELLDTLGLRYESGEFTRLLPFRANIDATMRLGGSWRIGLGIEQRYLPGYVPQMTLMGSRRVGPRTLLAATASYGGFGALRIGLAAKRRFGERLLVSLSTPHVPGFFMRRTRGLGLMAGIEFAF